MCGASAASMFKIRRGETEMAAKKPKLKLKTTKTLKRAKISVRPAGKPAAKPARKTGRMPGTRSAAKPAGKAGAKPATKSTGKPAAKKKAQPVKRGPAVTARPHVTRRPEEDPGVLKFVVLQPEVPEMPPVPEFEDLGELPESYGTDRVFLIARDPHWFYAYWDVSRERLAEARSASREGQVFLQVCETGGACVQQIMVPGESRNWFIYAGRPGVELYAELGYFDAGGTFRAIGRSRVARAPKDEPSTDLGARFVTIPMSLSFRELLELVTGQRHEGEGLAETLARLQERGFKFPFDVGGGEGLSEEAREVLFRQFMAEFTRRYWMGSMELAERWQQTERVSGLPPGVPFGASFGASPMGGPAWSGTIPRGA